MSISGASKVRPVDKPGSLSYTIVCNDCPGPYKDIIVSLRDDRMVERAKKVHDDLIPEAVCHRDVDGANRPLTIYSMPYLQVSALIEVQSVEVEMSDDEQNFEITDIVDWFLAAVMPFGMDLDILFMTTGFMTLDGWNDYACKS